MKLSKAELKSVVKECLLEILQEGLGSSLSSRSAQPLPVQSRNMFTEKARSSQGSVPQKTSTPALREAVRREAGGNKIMESILADTAASTLPKMLQNEGQRQPVAAGTVEQIVSSVDPEEIFGSEAASKWADLAFMGMNKK